MRIYYDTEFVEDGTTIDLVSIGLVAEDGREFYAVSSEFSISGLLGNPWLRENVWPSLPLKKHEPGSTCRCTRKEDGHLDFDHPDVRPRAQIARAVEAFILATPDVELWAWYGAYDHVTLCQLWGSMVDLPNGVPMWTNDLKQEAQRLGHPAMPKQDAGHHNALEDARHNKVMGEFLRSIES